jgi:hypothetical protein
MGRYGIVGQVINAPVGVNNMVHLNIVDLQCAAEQFSETAAH